MQKTAKKQALKPVGRIVRRAQNATARAAPGKKFLPPDIVQVSVNHSCPSVAFGAAPSKGGGERSRRLVLRFLRRRRARLTPAGAVMAAKKATKDAKDARDAKDAKYTKDAAGPAEIDDAADDEGQEQAPAKKRPPLKLVLVAIAALVLVSSAGGGAYYFFGSGHKAATATATASVVKPPVFFNMPDVLVNLSSSGSERTQYLKVKVVLELPNKAVEAQIEPLMPVLLDTFQTYLRELRASDLNGSAGLYRLKEELTRRINAEIAPNRINAVLFKELVVQ
jgi:flagellar protein FliL